jgi:hypothetical protein
MSKQENERRALLRACETLYGEISNGWSCYCLSKALNRAVQNHRFTSTPQLVRTTYCACMSEALLSLSKLTDTHKDALTIQRLINRTRQYLNRYAASQGVPALEAHARLLSDYDDLIKDVRQLRDKLIAHTDRGFAASPQSLEELNEIPMQPIGALYLEIQLTLNFVRENLDGVKYDFESIEKGIQQEMNRLQFPERFSKGE